MAKIVRPVFGVACTECEEQVPMARVRLIEGKGPVRCVSCASLREARHRNALRGARDSDVVIIRGR